MRGKNASDIVSYTTGSLIILILILVLSIYFPSRTTHQVVHDLHYREQLTKIRTSTITNTTTTTSLSDDDTIIVRSIQRPINKANTSSNNDTIALSDKSESSVTVKDYTITTGSNERTNITIAWLLSFPNSGTTYTLKFLQSITNTTTATNYGGSEQVGYEPSEPLINNVEGGPFLRYPDRRIPINPSIPIVTKSHCDPNTIRLSVDDFILSCRSGNRALADGSVLQSVYKIQPVKTSTNTTIQYDTTTNPSSDDGIPLAKIIHLIRNPFDNIVARLHYQRKHWGKEIHILQHQIIIIQDGTNNNSNNNNVTNVGRRHPDDESDGIISEPKSDQQQKQQTREERMIQEEIQQLQNKLEIYSDNQIGLRHWCNYLDRRSPIDLQHILQDLHPPIIPSSSSSINHTTTTPPSSGWFQRWEEFRKYNNGTMPPCLYEFYRYLQWHNNVVQMTLFNLSSSSSSTTDSTTNNWLHTVPLVHLYYENYTMPTTSGTNPIASSASTIMDEQINPTTGTIDPTNVDKKISILSNGSKELLEFLQVDLQTDLPGPVPIFYEGKQYSQTHYTLHDRIILGQIAESYLLPETWQLVQHYFPSVVQETKQ